MESAPLFPVETPLAFFCSACTNCPLRKNSPCCVPFRTRTYEKGEYIAHQHQKIKHLTILLKGKAQTGMYSDSGLRVPMEEIRGPYPLAAGFLFADKNRFPVEVTALEKCTIGLLEKESALDLIGRCPEFRIGFLRFNANRMQFLSGRIRILTQKGIKGKLAYHILAREHRGEFELGRSITSLAELFHVERPSLSRAIRELKQAGIIRFEKGKGRITDPERLQEVLLGNSENVAPQSRTVKKENA